MSALRHLVLAAMIGTAAAVTAAAPASAAEPIIGFGPCSGEYDIEVHVGSGKCVLVNYPTGSK